MEENEKLKRLNIELEKENLILKDKTDKQSSKILALEVENQYLEDKLIKLNHSLEEQEKISLELRGKNQMSLKNSFANLDSDYHKENLLLIEKEENIDQSKETEGERTFAEIYSEGLKNGFIEAEKLKFINYKNEKIVHDYFAAIEELEAVDIKILY